MVSLATRTNLSVADPGDLLEQPIVATLATYPRSGDPTPRDEAVIGVRIEGVVRAWDFAAQSD